MANVSENKHLSYTGLINALRKIQTLFSPLYSNVTGQNKTVTQDLSSLSQQMVDVLKQMGLVYYNNGVYVDPDQN